MASDELVVSEVRWQLIEAHQPKGAMLSGPSPMGCRLPPPCWTSEETLALIDSYREKWYSLRRGNLRAPHWQEVADAVAARSLHLPGATPKTSVQCRHKIEKLRKRYRSERHRSPSGSSPWPFYRKMDAMELGGSAAQPAAPTRPTRAAARAPSPPSSDPDSSDAGAGGNTRSIHRLMSNGGSGGRSAAAAASGMQFTIPKAVRSKVDHRSPILSPNPRLFKPLRSAGEEMTERLERKRKQRVREAEPEPEPPELRELVSAIRMVGDRFMRMEQMKMEMAREMEKLRMEMELKRTEMILESQRSIVDAFVSGLRSCTSSS